MPKYQTVNITVGNSGHVSKQLVKHNQNKQLTQKNWQEKMAAYNKAPGTDVQSRIRAMSERRDQGGGAGKNKIIVGTGLDTALARLNACGGGGACVPTNCPPGYTSAGVAGAGSVGAVDPFTGMSTGTGNWSAGGCCAAPCNSAFRIAYVGGASASVAAAASLATPLTIAPTVAMKPYKIYVPAGTDWIITSIKVGNRELLDGGSISAGVFGDMNMDSGRIESEWITSTMGMIFSATNVSANAAFFRPTVIGFVSN